VLDSLEAQQRDERRGEHREEHGQRRAATRRHRERADEHAETCRDRDVGGRGLKHEAEPCRHRRIAEDGGHGTEPRRHLVNAREPAQSFCRLDGAALGLTGQFVERGDLVES
jgi:hypothetical protein